MTNEIRVAKLERGSELRKVYVAASFPRKQDAIDLAVRIKDAGFRVVSDWLYDSSDDDIYEESVGTLVDRAAWDEACNAAEMDFRQMCEVDMLVVLTGDKLTRGGRHTEVGIALALNKPVFLFGPREQVFHWHKGVCMHLSHKTLIDAMIQQEG